VAINRHFYIKATHVNFSRRTFPTLKTLLYCHDRWYGIGLDTDGRVTAHQTEAHTGSPERYVGHPSSQQQGLLVCGLSLSDVSYYQTDCSGPTGGRRQSGSTARGDSITSQL